MESAKGSGDRSPRRSRDAARAAGEVIELLEVLWERGRDAVSSHPVSPSQLRVLYSLDREEGINLRTLGELLGSAPPSVSRLCDRLEALGFVERAPSPVSRRELELRLTGRGKTYLRELRARREEALLTAIAAMTPTARKALVEGLTGFQDAVEEAETVGRPKPGDSTMRSA
ncbi:MarR family transcriptional regulator [Streptomyces sp. A3M-1-3]|uniref:MarR family winged helix-turn-helix transcriptional regulator n=1 Tax=Streptomyces sp. A3M-1-3 TaxID=2962044 RepID=UPI0020B668F4|nr:MarR family transcriptional regulator [Streptomyces sp. A3M-1-3]MCP3822235.1 MarR family transcriptional regulator [Streptomyces sp. A3M-1-3]